MRTSVCAPGMVLIEIVCFRLDQMFSDAFSRDHQLLRADPKHSLYLACALMVRGNVQVSDIRRNIDRYHTVAILYLAIFIIFLRLIYVNWMKLNSNDLRYCYKMFELQSHQSQLFIMLRVHLTCYLGCSVQTPTKYHILRSSGSTTSRPWQMPSLCLNPIIALVFKYSE